MRAWPLATATSGLPTPGEAGFAACRAAGIASVELDLFGGGRDPGTPDGLAAFAAEAAQAAACGLTVWSVHLPFGGSWDISAPGSSAAEALASLLPAAAGWGARVAVVHGSAEPVRPEERTERMERSAASLGLLAAAARGAGIELALECLPRTCLGNRAAEVAALLQRVPGLRVCCDVNHLFHEAPADFIRALGRHIVTLHISDNDGRDERHWLPGRGTIDWPAVLEALSAVGYAGPFLFEVQP